MSVSREITIWCDACSSWEQDVELNATQLRRALKRWGWTQHRVEGRITDLCPECSNERTKQSNKKES